MDPDELRLRMQQATSAVTLSPELVTAVRSRARRHRRRQLGFRLVGAACLLTFLAATALIQPQRDSPDLASPAPATVLQDTKPAEIPAGYIEVDSSLIAHDQFLRTYARYADKRDAEAAGVRGGGPTIAFIALRGEAADKSLANAKRAAAPRYVDNGVVYVGRPDGETISLIRAVRPGLAVRIVGSNGATIQQVLQMARVRDSG